MILEPQLKNATELKLNEDEQKIKLTIPLSNPLVKEVIFELPQKKEDINMQIKELFNIINQQQIMINKLNERVKILEEEKEKEKEKELYYICNNSTIIPNDKEKDLALRKWVDENRIFFKIKLLFRMSRDGNQSSVYHQKCDNMENLLTIIQTNDNLKFGGFASKSWGMQGQSIDKTFMFSLNKMKKYERLNNNKAMHSGVSYGPVFGNAWDIYINSTMTSGCEQNNSNSVFFNKYEITASGSFSVKEIEVFQIE